MIVMFIVTCCSLNIILFSVLRVKMEEAMRRGVSELDVTTVMASGIPGSGKTTLRYFLFGELPPEIRISTACIESAQRGIIEVIGPQGELTVLKGVQDMTPVLESVSRDEVTRMEESAPKLQDTKSSEANGNRKEPAIHDQPPTSGSSEPEGIPLSTTTLSSKKAILDWLEKNEGSMQLKRHWVHFIDSGGQQQFLEILPCLIRNIGLLMLVFKLSEKLSERTVVEYWDPNGGHYLGQFSISTEKLLAYTAQLSCYHQPKINLPHVENPSDPRLKMVVVGTFKDQEDQCEESRQEKNERLEQTLALFQDQLIRPGPGSSCAGGVIFALNASLAVFGSC